MPQCHNSTAKSKAVTESRHSLLDVISDSTKIFLYDTKLIDNYGVL